MSIRSELKAWLGKTLGKINKGRGGWIGDVNRCEVGEYCSTFKNLVKYMKCIHFIGLNFLKNKHAISGLSLTYRIKTYVVK